MGRSEELGVETFGETPTYYKIAITNDAKLQSSCCQFRVIMAFNFIHSLAVSGIMQICPCVWRGGVKDSLKIYSLLN